MAGEDESISFTLISGQFQCPSVIGSKEPQLVGLRWSSGWLGADACRWAGAGAGAERRRWSISPARRVTERESRAVAECSQDLAVWLMILSSRFAS